MADVKPTEINNEDVQNYTVSSTNDPKNMQELTQYVSGNKGFEFTHLIFE